MKISGIFIGLFLMALFFGGFYTVYTQLGTGYGVSTTSQYTTTFDGITQAQNAVASDVTNLTNFNTQDSITPIGGITTTISIAANIVGLVRDMSKILLNVVTGSGNFISLIAVNIGLSGSPIIVGVISIFTVLIMFAIIAGAIRWYW